MQKQKELEMQSHIEKWKGSGLTKKDYCKGTGLSYDQFKYWCKQLGYIKKRRSRNSGTEFVTLQPVEPIQTINKPIEITYPNGVRVQISGDTPIKTIHSLIQIR